MGTPSNPPGPPPLPAGSPGGTTQPCKWKIGVRVHSNERFVPKDAFDVVFGAIKADPAAKPDSLIPPIPSAWYSGSAKIDGSTLISNECVFADSVQKSGGVTAKVYKLSKEADWVLADGAASTTLLGDQNLAESIDCGQEHKLDLFIRHPLKLYLEFKFKDPEKKSIRSPRISPSRCGKPSRSWSKRLTRRGASSSR